MAISNTLKVHNATMTGYDLGTALNHTHVDLTWLHYVTFCSKCTRVKKDVGNQRTRTIYKSSSFNYPIQSQAPYIYLMFTDSLKSGRYCSTRLNL